jgi:four helix bundle protein
MSQLPFETLDVYQYAVKFAAAGHRLCATLPRGFGHIADHVRRASCSSLANTTEALVEFAPDEKSRIFRLGLRETGESWSLVALLQELNAVSPADVTDIKDFGARLFAMQMRMANPARRS